MLYPGNNRDFRSPGLCAVSGCWEHEWIEAVSPEANLVVGVENCERIRPLRFLQAIYPATVLRMLVEDTRLLGQRQKVWSFTATAAAEYEPQFPQGDAKRARCQERNPACIGESKSFIMASKLICSRAIHYLCLVSKLALCSGGRCHLSLQKQFTAQTSLKQPVLVKRPVDSCLPEAGFYFCWCLELINKDQNQ